MKRITTFVLSLLLAISFMSVCGVAKENNEMNTKIVVNSENGENGEVFLTLRIWGETTTGKMDRVSVKIVRPDVDEDDTSLSLFQKYAYIDQTKTDNAGNYIFEVDFNEDSAEYTIITIDSKGIIDEKKILRPSSSRMTDFFSKINNKKFTEEETMDDYLGLYSQELGIDISIYSRFEETVRKEICDVILDETYTDMGTLYSKIEESILLTGADLTQNTELIGDLLAYYDTDVIKLSDHTIYSEYSSLNSDEKDIVHKMISGYKTDSVENVKKAFIESVFTKKIKDVDNYKEILVVFDDYSEYVDLDLSKFETLSSDEQDKVLYYLSEEFKNINNFGDLVSEFDDKIDNIDELINDENTENSSTGSSGGGGGGGGGGTTIKIDSAAVPELPDMVDTGNEYQEKEVETVAPDYDGAEKFIDLSSVDWARDAIFDLNEKGILSGREDKKFYPNDNTTRAEFVKMVTTSMKIKEDKRDMSFADVSESDWFYPYIKTAYSNGLINGTGNGNFSPNEKISRQDAATIIYKAMTLKNYIFLAQVDAKSISDYNSIDNYAKNSVLMLKSYGVISGYTDGTFKPKKSITRAECALMIYNVMNTETYLDATREYISETDGLLDVGNAKVVNQFSKAITKDIADAKVYPLDSETDYVGQIRNQNISAANSEFNTTTLYLDFDISHLREGYDVSRAFIDIVVKANADETYYPQDVKICAYKYDAEGKNKRFPTDKGYIGNMLDSKMIYKDYKEVKSSGFYVLTLEVSEAVVEALNSASDTVRIVLSLDSNDLKGYTEQILKGKNTFTATDFSFGVVINTQATRQHDGTSIVYGNSQPVLKLYN